MSLNAIALLAIMVSLGVLNPKMKMLVSGLYSLQNVLLPSATRLRQGNVFTRVSDSVHRGGTETPQTETPLDRDPLDRPTSTETPLDRDPPDRDPLDRDPSWTETPLTETPPLDRDAPRQRPPNRDPSVR